MSVTTLKPFSNAVRIVDSTQQLVSSPPSTLVHLCVCVCVYMHTQSAHILKHTQMQTQTKAHRHSTHTQTHTHTTVLMPFLRSWASRSVPGKASSPRLPLITMSPSCGSIPVCVFVRLCVCVPCVCTSVCACVHVCVCACVHVCIYIHTHACMPATKSAFQDPRVKKALSWQPLRIPRPLFGLSDPIHACAHVRAYKIPDT